MATISNGELINLTQLSHIIRNADTILWKYDPVDDKHIIASPTFIMRVGIDPRAKTMEVLEKRFNGQEPYGIWLKSVQARKRYEVEEADASGIEPLTNRMAEANIGLFDTRLQWERGDGLHVYYAWRDNDRSYIFIAQKYHALLNRVRSLQAEAPKANSPVLFTGGGGEFLIALPVVWAPNQFLAKP